MKIKVSRIKPNPYRRIKTYPIDEDKVKRLETSIQETTFWDNLVARPHPKREGYFQLAYGHHRLMALENLGINTIDIPVRNIDNATMLRIMANENLEWNQCPAVINETVHAARDFLDRELKKYATWEEAKCPNKFIRALFTGTKGDFKHCKNHGVGQTTILKFLGKNWEGKRWMIQEALSLLDNKDDVDIEAVESLETMGKAREFHKAIKEHKIPKERHKKLAKKCKNKGDKKIGQRRIREIVREESDDPSIDLEKKFNEMKTASKHLREAVVAFQTFCNDLNVTTLKGMEVEAGWMELALCMRTIKDFVASMKESEDENE